ncbi:MAG: MarR family transcriptional regulator [Flavobacteriaceae bacterium]|nr:MarR family transcriptional regulator [Flavobacteriaceae bacterium]
MHKTIVVELIRSGFLISDRIASVVKTEDITLPQFNVLRILRGRKGAPASLNEVKSAMIQPNSNVTRIADKLVDKGLISRKICPNNKRQIEMLITEKGLNTLKRLDDQITDAEQNIVNCFSDADKKQFNQYLNQLNLNLKS